MAPKVLECKVPEARLVLHCGTLSRYEFDDNKLQSISFGGALIERLLAIPSTAIGQVLR